MYHDREHLKSSNILILSPNSVFSDYISHILPELGEENIQEMSFDLFAYRELKEIVPDCEDRYDQLERNMKLQDLYLTERFEEKQSEGFVGMMEGFLASLEDELMDFRTIEYKGIQKMEEEHIICGYHTLINWEKTDIEKVSALIEVRVTPQRGQGFDSIAERIYKYPEVRSVYLMSGAYDLMVILEGKTLREVSNFVSDKLSTLDSVLSTATHFILKKYKDHGTAFATKKEDEREMITP